MRLSEIKDKIHPSLYEKLEQSIDELRPAQEKSIASGLLDQKNMLICTPTASGKTLIAEFAMFDSIYRKKGKAVYIVPLKALATEKLRHFRTRYPDLRVAMSIGDIDSSERFLDSYDLIITTSEKLDSLIRHRSNWIRDLAVVVIDEIHLLNDPKRGPTLEILITMLRSMLKCQMIGLSATIGNPEELSDWLSAELVSDDWRPVELQQGVLLAGDLEIVK